MSHDQPMPDKSHKACPQIPAQASKVGASLKGGSLVGGEEKIRGLAGEGATMGCGR